MPEMWGKLDMDVTQQVLQEGTKIITAAGGGGDWLTDLNRLITNVTKMLEAAGKLQGIGQPAPKTEPEPPRDFIDTRARVVQNTPQKEVGMDKESMKPGIEKVLLVLEAFPQDDHILKVIAAMPLSVGAVKKMLQDFLKDK